MTHTDALRVAAAERGCIRVFTLELPPSDVTSLQDPKGDAPSTGAAVAHLLGLDWLDEDFIEIFDIDDLETLGLAGYLVQGNGVSKDDIAPDVSRLSALTGPVLIVYSGAFGDEPAVLKPARALEYVGLYQEERSKVAFTPLPSKAAKEMISPSVPNSSNPHLTLLWALLALPVLAILLGILVFGVLK